MRQLNDALLEFGCRLPPGLADCASVLTAFGNS